MIWSQQAWKRCQHLAVFSVLGKFAARAKPPCGAVRWGAVRGWWGGGLASVGLKWQCVGLGHQISGQRVYPSWQCTGQGPENLLRCQRNILSREPSFSSFKKGMDVQVSELWQQKVQAEINTEVSYRVRRVLDCYLMVILSTVMKIS